jgi:hypothetical protein
VEAGDAARGPPEAPLRVSQIRHDVAVGPLALFGAGTPQIRRWRASVVYCPQSGRKSVKGESLGVGALTNVPLRGRRR